MQVHLKWTAAAAATAVGFVLVFRLLNGLDPLTGDDPKVIAALRSNPTLEITSVPKSQGIYEVVDRSTGLKTYFDLARGEALRGPLQLARCAEGSKMGLPTWLPRFPGAADWTCLSLATDAGEQRHAAFVTSLQGLEAAFAFYADALEKIPSSGGGASISRAPIWSGTQFRHNLDTGRRVTVRYFYDVQDRRYGPLVTVAYADGD